MKHEVPAIVIAGSSWRVPTALGVVRSLGRAGVPVICIVEERQQPVVLSRYVRAVIACDGHSETAIVDALFQAVERYGTKLPVFPTSDK